MEKKETPILIAAKNGVIELVKMILELFPVAIHDVNSEKKNVVLLAVENRQPNVCLLLLRLKMKETIFRNVDRDGNTALHLAAKLGDNQPWGIPGAALQMQWEIKWFKFVESLMPWRQVRYTYNAEGKTPQELFTESHKHLVEAGGAWLARTSESWSAVAVLIATVAFTTSSAIPGGVNQDTGIPTLERQPIFGVFAISSPIALCFAVLSLMMFLAIRTSMYQEKDFGVSLPGKLIVGMTSLFMSMAAILVSFFAGHFALLEIRWQYAALTLYAAATLPMLLFAISQFPLYYDVARITLAKLPPIQLKQSHPTPASM